jgi:hypothetical protein
MKKLKINRHSALTVLVILMVLVMVSCADVTNIDACRQNEPYGFLGGLWHGLIAPFSFFISLFSDSAAMYAVNNNGGWYDFGFVLGAGILFGGGSRATR